jgi:hypothetical protein
MDVFVIPIGHDRFELLCEDQSRVREEREPSAHGMLGSLRERFVTMLRLAEEREDRPDDAHQSRSWWDRMQERVLAWVAERIAEQRLLWNLRRETSAVAVHPEEMPFDQVMTLIRRTLQRDYERHRVWLVVDTLGLIVSGLLTLVPGPNLIAYFFAFRVVGHWLSMRGATQGLRRVSWTGRQSAALTELGKVMSTPPDVRAARVNEIAGQLRLRKLPRFLERVAAPGA